jgi:hypothetical protein
MNADEARQFHAALRQRFKDDGIQQVFRRARKPSQRSRPPLKVDHPPANHVSASQTADWERELIALACAYGRARWCWEGTISAPNDRRGSALQLLVELEAQAWQYGGMVLRELGVTDFLEFERSRFRALHSYLVHLGVM